MLITTNSRPHQLHWIALGGWEGPGNKATTLVWLGDGDCCLVCMDLCSCHMTTPTPPQLPHPSKTSPWLQTWELIQLPQEEEEEEEEEETGGQEAGGCASSVSLSFLQCRLGHLLKHWESGVGGGKKGKASGQVSCLGLSSTAFLPPSLLSSPLPSLFQCLRQREERVASGQISCLGLSSTPSSFSLSFYLCVDKCS